jgi:trigger factor
MSTLAGTMSHSHHHHDIDFKSAFTVTKEPGSQVKIAGEIPFSELEHERAGAITHLGRNLKIDGFRPGHVPEAMIVKTVGAMAILAEMAERAIAHMYPHILEEHNVDAIGYPQVSITKIAEGNPLGFTATVTVVPEITLPDYKALAATTNKSRESLDVTDTDVEKQIADILRQKMAYERLQNKAAAKNVNEGIDAPEAEEVTPIETEEDFAKLPLPELTEELVKTLGQPGQFTDIADFKAKIREHLEVEKKRDGVAKHRAVITDTIIAAATIDLPQLLIDTELNQMFAQMNEDLERANLKMEDYLKHIKKTVDDMKKDWTPAAEKRARLQLILNEIAKREAVKPDETQLNEQVNQLLEQYKDADRHRVTVYVASVMTNEAVMKLLESL